MADIPLRFTTLLADDRPADGNRPALEPLLVSARDLARLLGLSLRTVRALDSSGRLPQPLRLGQSVRWKLSELRAWLDAGAPDRETWARVRASRS